MPERSKSDSGRLALLSRETATPFIDLEKALERERAESMAILHMHRRNERRQRLVHRMISLWPLGAGLLLAAFAPTLQTMASAAGPWGMTLVFPFVVLAARPEIQVGPITHLLPIIMLYAQFPIEGLLARIVLKRRVRPIGVIVNVLLFHFLGIAELFMLSGAASQFLSR